MLTANGRSLTAPTAVSVRECTAAAAAVRITPPLPRSRPPASPDQPIGGGGAAGARRDWLASCQSPVNGMARGDSDRTWLRAPPTSRPPQADYISQRALRHVPAQGGGGRAARGMTGAVVLSSHRGTRREAGRARSVGCRRTFCIILVLFNFGYNKFYPAT